jgi:glucosamine--fructose-6-phosphate aminotransferase (isomerizing)
MIDRGFPVLLVAPSGRVLGDIGQLALLLEGRNAELIAISDDPGILARSRAALPLPTGMPEWVTPMVAVVPGQIWAVALARTRGLDPDQPRGLSKVTETR